MIPIASQTDLTLSHKREVVDVHEAHVTRIIEPLSSHDLEYTPS